MLKTKFDKYIRLNSSISIYHFTIIMFKKILLLLLFELIAFNFLSAEEDKILYQAQKFKYMLETINAQYADTVDFEKLCDKTFSFMLKSLDEQSLYYSNDEYKKIKESYSGVNVGVGLEVVKLGDTLYVYEVYKKSSADSAGLVAGDKIMFINGTSVKDLSTNDANNLILGDTNTYVELIIKRGFSNNLTIHKLRRAVVELPSVKAEFMIDGSDIGYIAFSRFTDISDVEFKESVERLVKLGMKKLLLDLRGNPGGYLNKAAFIADQFIPGEKTITYTEARNQDNVVKYTSKNGDILEGMPIIVLMDKNSASGSEIIAGAVQDFDLGLVVGETSFGKGSIQKFWNMNDGSAFRITVGKYHTPSGRSIQKPSIKEDNAMIDPAMELSHDSETIKRVNEALKATGGRTHLPLFKTAKGRTIIGAGGIIPDVMVKSDTTTLLTTYFKSRGIFLEWAFRYLAENSASLQLNYKDNPKKFYKEWQISNENLKEFVNLAVSKKLWNDSMFVKDKSYIINYMKASVADLFFGHNEYFRILQLFDKQVQEAIIRFYDAENILKN